MTEHTDSHGSQRIAAVRQAAAPAAASAPEPEPGRPRPVPEPGPQGVPPQRRDDAHAGTRPAADAPSRGRTRASSHPEPEGLPARGTPAAPGPAPAPTGSRATGSPADGSPADGSPAEEPRAAGSRTARSRRAEGSRAASSQAGGVPATSPRGGRSRTRASGAASAALPAATAERPPSVTADNDAPKPAAGAPQPEGATGPANGGDGAQAAAPSGPGAGPVGTTGGERLRFVGAATRRIARGIDLDEIVLGLCRATVPTFADAILVYLRDPLPVGDERPVGPVVLRLRRTDQLPEHVRGVGEGDGTDFAAERPEPVPDLAGCAAERCEVRIGGPLAEVLRGVRPVFGDSSAARAALPELLGDDRPVPDRHRTILAPLRGRRRVIGAAVFIRRPDRAAFENDDLLVAAQLATHTALGVDKAVLYGREVYIADELQRTMLPDSLPQPTGVRLASRYLPAAETARVGGDWYDAIPLPGNRVALVVGDVMGHSMTSAAIMGQLRTTAQTLAGLDLPPAEVLHHLDEQAQRLGSDRMATCMYAVYDPVAHRIVIANAGHPPPILLHRGGRAEVLRVPPGAPIGVGGVDFEAVELDAPAGATLLLYTDGLVESRIRDVWTGIEQLRERLIETARLTGPNPPPLEPLCDEVLGMLGPGDRDDDIALLAARFEGIAPSDVAYWFLDPRPQTARQARRLARRALTRWGLEELTDSVELLVSEVITNAVRYAERPITLRLLRTDVLRCEVGDDVPQLPRLRQARPSDEGGRGLYLVNRLARRWGATRLSTGKVVWFELALPPRAR
ncbi:SpoIIE family protein phosphatase [Streptomyces telluris]|uniref:protein-serine/threonine phosphatase n=1 Tax=Streptomyces telluris TaxID=2720021 RepID=A0A9X2LFV7_9ACTN|nr:SpoIIE family protein phosphatase [Streptomyces telluris]MCQ8770199.1 SpoIIE family protein phosphatase [Streptomyces telluris]